MTLSHEAFLKKIHAEERVQFDQTIAVIAENYRYEPVEFENGLDSDKVLNSAGKNEGSCKIFSFAQLQNLSKEQTLNLFGDYYWIDVLSNPEGNDHQNIRQFMRHGWAGIHFKGTALTQK